MPARPAQLVLEDGTVFRGHEFHYATALDHAGCAPLFQGADARGSELAPLGIAAGNVMGSFAHLVDRADG